MALEQVERRAPWVPPEVAARRFASARIALVHDWLTGMRGGERVLEVLCRLFPHADLHTLIYDPGRVSAVLRRMRVVPSPLQRLPGARRHFRWLLPIFPWAFGRFNLSAYDLVISVSHGAAKSVRVPRHARHLCYLLTPPRYLWDGYDDYFGPGRAAWPVRLAAGALRRPLQAADRRAAERVDTLLAVSAHVQARARRHYGRDAAVVHPPVALERFAPAAGRDDFYLYVGALTPNKRVERAVAAFTRLGLPLRVVGEGPELRRCRRAAGPTVRFLGPLPDEEVAALYARARAVVFPGCDDFGIVPVEAQASGTPVIALAAGGALETVTPETGILYDDPSPEGLMAAVARFAENPGRFPPGACTANAARFATGNFVRGFLRELDSCCPE